MSRLNKQNSVREVKSEVERDGREASRKGDNLEISAMNTERLNQLDKDLTASLPTEEAQKISLDMQAAYSKGKADFRLHEEAMEKHLRKEEETKQEIAKAVDDASHDARVFDQAARAERDSPIADVLRSERTEMERIKQALDEVVTSTTSQIDKDRGRQSRLERTVENIKPVGRKSERTNYVLQDNYMKKIEEKKAHEEWERSEHENKQRMAAEYNQKKYNPIKGPCDSGYKSSDKQ